MTPFVVFFHGNECKAQNAEQKIAFANYHKYYQSVPVAGDDKEKAILSFRNDFSKKPYHAHSMRVPLEWSAYVSLLGFDGRFSDLQEKEKTDPAIIVEAYNRLWKIAEAYRSGKASEKKIMTPAFLQSIIYYGNIEAARPNDWQRFHASCFAAPTAAVNIYFCFLQQMNAVEEGTSNDQLLKDACDMLKVIALQAWTQPFRDDPTDNNVVQIERFRNHVWWVGGNALGYRPLLAVAFMYRSSAMVDLLSQVSSNGIGVTAQAIYHQSFWTEGITADGAGWGHGKQCLVWGYPIDGTIGALGILSALKGSPWERTLTADNKEALFNYFRGSNWYYYKGYIPPCLDRGSMSYNVSPRNISYSGLLNTLINDWLQCFTADELSELKQLQNESKNNNIQMQQFAEGVYNGTRWFYNNDDLIKKTKDYHLIINMASNRCDGLESAADFADRYNFYTNDGLTLFEKDGKEYRSILGAWDVTASPGVTAREGMDKLTPVTNWRGYTSKYSFAGGATNGGSNSVAGFAFEKMNASERKDVNDKADNLGKNPVLYGVRAYKSYFIIGDYMVALGAGITNLNPAMPGAIRTTIDQTAIANKITIIENGKEKPVTPGQSSFESKNGLVWVKQAGKFAYTVLPQDANRAFYVCETKATDWAKMNYTNRDKKDLPAQAEILRLWIDHGQQPVNDKYEYAVYMGNQNPAAALPVEVLRNDSSIQAVRSIDKKITEAVIYNSSKSLESKDLKLKVSAPCVVLLENVGNDYVVSVTDANMNDALNEIVITINNKPFSFTMPKGKDSGRPVTKRLGNSGLAKQ
jgi:hypothetical protein